MKKMVQEKEPQTAKSGEPLNQEQLTKLLRQVFSGQKPFEMFIAELARSASSLTKKGIKILGEELKNLPRKEG